MTPKAEDHLRDDASLRVPFDPATMDSSAFYRVLNSVVLPRPIAWLTSQSRDGVVNLAPPSFYRSPA